MDPWEEFARKLKGQPGTFRQDRTDPKLLRVQYELGLSQVLFAHQVTITAHITRWKTLNPRWQEVGTAWTADGVNGVFVSMFKQLLADAGSNIRFFAFSTNPRFVGIATQKLAFRRVTESFDEFNLRGWAQSLGIEDKIEGLNLGPSVIEGLRHMMIL